MDVGLEVFCWPGKRVASQLDYSVDWTAWLDGDTIVTSTWSIVPIGATPGTGDCTLQNATPPVAGGVATVWVSAGISGRFYNLSNTITTVGSGGIARIESRQGKLLVLT